VKRGEVRVGLVNGFGVALAFLVLGERPVDTGQAGVAAFAFSEHSVTPSAPPDRVSAG